MKQATGSETRIIIGEESVYGTTPGTPDGKLLYFVKGGPTFKQGLKPTNTIMTGTRGKGRSVLGNISDDGTLEVELGSTHLGLLFKHLLGTVTTVNNNDGTYTHTFKVGALPAGLWLEQDDGEVFTTGRYVMHNGVVINDATFTLGTEGPVPVSFGLLGRNATPADASVDATPTDWGFYPFSHFDCILMDDDVELANVESGSLKLANNRDTGTYVVGGQGKRAAAKEGQVDISGSLTVLYTDKVLLNKSLTRTNSDLKLVYQRGNGLGTLNNESLAINIANLDYEPNTPEISGPTGRKATLNFMGYKSGNDIGFEIVLKNMVASY